MPRAWFEKVVIRHFAHLRGGARVACPIKGERQPVEGPWNGAADADRFMPQAYGLLQPSRVFEVEAEVVSYPPEQLGPSLLACSLDSGLSYMAASA